MMQEHHAFQRQSGVEPAHRSRPFAIGGLIARFRDWFSAPGAIGSADTSRGSVGNGVGPSAPEAQAHGAASVVARLSSISSEPRRSFGTSVADCDTEGGRVVPLPLNGRRLLAQLSQQLSKRFGSSESLDDPLLLTLTTGAQPRLWIDSTAHVDVRDAQFPYRVVLGDALATRVILETSDFAEVTDFVGLYLLLTRGEPKLGEGGA